MQSLLDTINLIQTREEQLNKIIKELEKPPTVTISKAITTTRAGDYQLAPGLANVGNTCFHTSAVQLFYRMEELIPFLINNKIHNQYKENSYIYNFISLLGLMRKNSSTDHNSVLVAGELHDLVIKFICPIFGKYRTEKQEMYAQEDAGELLIYIIDGLQLSCTSSYLNIGELIICKGDPGNYKLDKKFPESDPRNLYMITKSEKYCKTNYETIDIDDIDKDTMRAMVETCEDFRVGMKVDIPVLPLTIDTNDTMSLSSIILDNQTPEAMTKKDEHGVNFLYIKKTVITNSSKYLFIQLNCFTPERTKIHHKIQLDGLDINNKTYNLVGIIYHSGSTLEGGHYTTNIKHNTGWYEYNDSSRKRINDYDKSYMDNDYAKQPYILLYQTGEYLAETTTIDDVKANLEAYLKSI